MQGFVCAWAFAYLCADTCIYCHGSKRDARERKSKVKDIQKIIQSVVNASSDKDAKKVIAAVTDYIGGDSDNATIE